MFFRKAGGVSWLVVFLGNPGREYENTRHNAGFLAIDYFAETLGIKINRAKYDALCAEARVGDKNVLLMKPQTYMNRSGTAISAAADFYKIPPQNILVLCDDITQNPGKLRIRRSGSAGGHNGLKNIIEYGGSDKFPRIRIGIRDEEVDIPIINYVLSEIRKDDYPLFGDACKKAGEATAEFVRGLDIEKVMCKFN